MTANASVWVMMDVAFVCPDRKSPFDIWGIVMSIPGLSNIKRMVGTMMSAVVSTSPNTLDAMTLYASINMSARVNTLSRDVVGHGLSNMNRENGIETLGPDISIITIYVFFNGQWR